LAQVRRSFPASSFAFPPRHLNMAPKRTSVASKVPAKKARTVAPEAPLLEFLHKCDEIPKPCREMLQAAVPICLEVVEGDRHKFQVEVLSRVGSLLANVEAKKRGAIGEAEAGLAEIEAEITTGSADANGKEALATAKKSECDEKQVVVDAAREVTASAQQTLAGAQKEEETFNAKKAEVLAEQEGFAKLISEIFTPLKEGTFEGVWQKRNKAIAELTKKLAELGGQESLGDGLTEALKLKPINRTATFAKVTVQFAEEEFDKHTAKTAQGVAAFDAEEATHKKAIADAEAVATEKKAALDAVAATWDQMQDVWVALENESSAAKRELKKTEARIPRAQKSVDKLKADLEKFMEVPTLFSKLKEHSTKAPEEPEAPEEEAAEEEEASAAVVEGEAPDAEMVADA